MANSSIPDNLLEQDPKRAREALDAFAASIKELESVKITRSCPKCGKPVRDHVVELPKIPTTADCPRDPLEMFRPLGPGGANWTPEREAMLHGMSIDEFRMLHTPLGPPPSPPMRLHGFACTECDWAWPSQK